MRRQEIYEVFSQEIKRHEGWFAPSVFRPFGSRSFRNRNEGNLKTGARIVYKNQVGWDYSGFARFRTVEDGHSALLKDIEAKFTGKSRTGLGLNSTILQFFQVYAPASDNNRPYQYAMSVVQGLNEKGLKVSVYDSLGKLLSLATDELKILAVLYKVQNRERLDGLLGSFATYLKNAFENTKDISLKTYELPKDILLNYIKVDIRVGVNYELQQKEIIDISQLRSLLTNEVTDEKLIYIIDCDGRGMTMASPQSIDGALVNQMNFVTYGDETVFLDDLIHEFCHFLYYYLNQNGLNLEDDVHKYSSITDQRVDARYTALFQKLKTWWGLI